MLDFLSLPLVQDLAVNLAVSLVVFAIGFLIGKRRERRLLRGRNLEQYEFYPFTVDPQGFPQFNGELFQRGVDHLLSHPDATAASQLVIMLLLMLCEFRVRRWTRIRASWTYVGLTLK